MAANGHANGENVNGTHEMADDAFLFTSESVNEGHPDKLCDQVVCVYMLVKLSVVSLLSWWSYWIRFTSRSRLRSCLLNHDFA